MRFTNRIILILWAIACGPLAACSDGGTEAPGPENGTQTIVWTPAVPVRDAAVVFSLEGSPDNIHSTLRTLSGLPSSEKTTAASLTGTAGVQTMV